MHQKVQVGTTVYRYITTNLGPGVSLSLVLEVSSSGLEQRLIDTSTARDDADHSAVGRGNGFLGTGRKLDL